MTVVDMHRIDDVLGLLYLHCPVWIDAISTVSTVLPQKTALSMWVLVTNQPTYIRTCEVSTDEKMEEE